MSFPIDEQLTNGADETPRKGVGVASNPELADGVQAERPRLGGQAARPLTVDEVKGILSNEIQDSIGGEGSTVAQEQQTALDFYYGRPLGNEMKDRSQVVLLDVLEVVEWAMPSLMRMFTGSNRIARFKPKRPEDQRKADLATAYINHVFVNEMDGFQILYDWFKTALLEKNGIVKVYWEERVVPKSESYSGLTMEEVMLILDKEGVEPVAVNERSEMMQDSDTGMQQEMPVFDLETRMVSEEKRIRVDSVPPEQFLISRKTVRLDDETVFSAHRKRVSLSDLVAQGYPLEILTSVPFTDTPEYTSGRMARRDNDDSYPSGSSSRTDMASREVWTTECYARVDEDGDGYSELRRFLVVGESSLYILDDEEIMFNPFCSLSPIPMPHKFYGQSLADLVTDLQVIRSTILRQMLDHLYLANNPRMAITEGMVEIDDLLTVRPGGLVRQRAPGSIEPLVTQDLPRDTFPMLQYLEQVRANRTGVMAQGNDLDAGLLSNTTAAAVSSMEGAKQQKIELIARIFASTGLKQMFEKMLRLMATNDTKERQVQLSGEWVTINPASWNFEFDVEVEVGLGSGRATEQVQNLSALMGIQSQMATQGMMNYLVTPQNLYQSASRMAEAMGYNNPDLFFQNPEGVEPPQPPPDPDMERLQFEMQEAQAAMQMKQQDSALAMKKEENLRFHRAEDLASKERVALAKIESAERVAHEAREAQVESAEVAAKSRMETGEPE
jgi:hypothetical protein